MKKYDAIARCIAAIVLIALAYLLTGCEAVGREMKGNYIHGSTDDRN